MSKWRRGSSAWGSMVEKSGTMKKFLAQKAEKLVKAGSGPKAGTEDANAKPKNVAAANREAAVMEMLESFHLDGGKFHTSMVVARSGERMLGGKDDRGVIELKWMRLPSGGQGVVALEDVTGGFYQPSIDDVGGSVLCQCCDASDAAASTFAEYGPVVMDPAIADAISAHLVEEVSKFPVEPALQFGVDHQLHISESHITLLRLPDDDEADGATTEVASCALSAGVTVVLPPSEVSTLRLQLGPSSGAVDLLARSNKDRDIIAGLIRGRIAECTTDGDGDGATAATQHSNAQGEASESVDAAEAGAADDASAAAPAAAGDHVSAAGGSAGAGAPRPAPPPPPERNAKKAPATAAAAKEVKYLERRIAELSLKVREQAAKTARAEQELEIVSQERAAMKTEMTALASEAAAQQNRVVRLTDESSSLRDKQKELIARISELENEADGVAALRKNDQDALAAAAAKSGDFEAEALGLKVKVQALTRDVKAARADFAASAKALEAAKTECAKLQVIADERAASLVAIKRELQDERATVATLRDTIASAATTSAAGEQELATVTQQLAEAQARADAAEARAATQDDLISTLQRSEAELKARVESTDGDFAALREELAAAKEAAVASQDELDEMTALYNAANKKSRSLSKRMAKLLQESTPQPGMEEIQHEKNQLLVATQVAKQEAQQLREELAEYKAMHHGKAKPARATAVSAPAPAPAPTVVSTTPGAQAIASPSSSRSLFGIRIGSSASPATKVVKVAASSSGKQNQEMQRLIRDLTDQLRDKEEALLNNKTTKEFLVKRIQALEAKLEEAGVSPPA